MVGADPADSGALIMTAFAGRAFYTPLETFLGSYLGLADAQVRALAEMNWVRRRSNGDCNDRLFRRETRVDWGGPASPPPPFAAEADDDDCGGETDEEDEQELRPADRGELDERDLPDATPPKPTGVITGDWKGDDDKGHDDPAVACDDECRSSPRLCDHPVHG